MNKKTKIFSTILSLSVLLISIGCTTIETTSTVLGTAIGAGAGAIIGHQSGHSGEGAAIGAGVGALTGALVGSSIENKNLKSKNYSLEQQNRVLYSSNRPESWVNGHYEYIQRREWIDTTTIQRVWINGYRIGNRYIIGHYEIYRAPSGYYILHEERIWVPGYYK